MVQEAGKDDTIGAEGKAEKVTRDVPDEIRITVERVWLAGMGAVARTCDIADDQFNRFVRRGEAVREEMRDRAHELRRSNEGTRMRVRDYFRQTMDTVLDGFNVPNKTDVDTINAKLNILTRKIDDLQIQGADRVVRKQASRGRGAPPPAETDDVAT
jgi:poly(hydroxyalkanoate) granule-associated protein